MAAIKGRNLVLAIAASAFLFQLYLSGVLSTLSSTLKGTIENEDGEGEWRVKLEAVRALVGIGRFWALSSAFVAALGFVGALRSNLPFLRLFSLHSFLSLLAELSLLVIATFLTFSSTSPSSLCETLSNSEIATSFDLFGWSVEACEEQWQGLFSTLTVCLAAITIVRGCCALKVLQFYTALSKQGARKSLTINTRDRHASDNGSSRDAPSPSSGKRPSRIFLLPSPVDTFSANLGADVPLLSLTPSSPSYPSFPPPPSGSGAPQPEQQYLVYAPVLMSAEEARKLQAKEVVFSRPRSRSQLAASPLSSQPPSASAIPDVPLILESKDELALGKGKLA